jgi:hypothetical protein
MVSPPHCIWHLIPKWLFDLFARTLVPQLLSKIACAKVTLAGILYSTIWYIASSAWVSIYVRTPATVVCPLIFSAKITKKKTKFTAEHLIFVVIEKVPFIIYIYKYRTPLLAFLDHFFLILTKRF